MRLKQYLLTEKTWDIQHDVDMIYNVAFRSFLKSFLKNPVGNKEYKKIKDHGMLAKLYTSDLKTEECKLAHSFNPCKIECGIVPIGSFYQPGHKLISISLNYDVVNILYRGGATTVNKRLFSKELNESKIKATTWHELSHWLNDTIHNRNITKLINVAADLKNSEVLLLNKPNINMTHFEIDALIHGIKGVKNIKSKIWDKMDLEDLFVEYTSLTFIYNTIYSKHGQDVVNVWQKLLVKRMVREGLLGKNMKKLIRGKIRT